MKDVCPVCGQEVNTTFLDGELVFDTHFIPREGSQCAGSGMPISQSSGEAM